MVIRVTVVAFAVALSLAAVSSAWAYSEVATTTANRNISPSDCSSCHSLIAPGSQGPHSGYTATSRGCAGCHQVHSAPGAGYALLPGETMTETCELCHDGTGGHGVYGAIEARGLTVAAEHRTETTATIPGGNEVTGDPGAGAFSGLGGTLSCGDCHAPHGSEPVGVFTHDRMRNASDVQGNTSNQLLRRRATGAAVETPVYGSDWCAGCHRGRVSGVHDLINHPVDASQTVGPSAFTYEQIARVTGVDAATTEFGALGHSNYGYVMPWPRTAQQGTHSPICQQCHEDGRNVGDSAVGRISIGETFTVTAPDGGAAGDNPRFQAFPHESQVSDFLIETDDDLCTNCHTPDQLP